MVGAPPAYSLRIISYSIIRVVAPQLGFGSFPQFFCLQRPGLFQPVLEVSYFRSKLLTRGLPLDTESCASPILTAVVGKT